MQFTIFKEGYVSVKTANFVLVRGKEELFTCQRLNEFHIEIVRRLHREKKIPCRCTVGIRAVIMTSAEVRELVLVQGGYWDDLQIQARKLASKEIVAITPILKDVGFEQYASEIEQHLMDNFDVTTVLQSEDEIATVYKCVRGRWERVHPMSAKRCLGTE